MKTNGALAPFSGSSASNYYHLNRKRKQNSFNLRNNIYNQRVDNNVTKQFKEIHNQIKGTEYTTDEIRCSRI